MIFFSSDEAFDHVFQNEVREEMRTRTPRKQECQKCGKWYVYVYHRDRHEEQSVPSQVSPATKANKRCKKEASGLGGLSTSNQAAQEDTVLCGDL